MYNLFFRDTCCATFCLLFELCRKIEHSVVFFPANYFVENISTIKENKEVSFI